MFRGIRSRWMPNCELAASLQVANLKATLKLKPAGGDMKTKWKRLLYFAIGAALIPILLSLTIFIVCIAAQQPLGRSSLVGYAISAFLGALTVVAGSAFRAAFRTPPWWIITPEKRRESEKLAVVAAMVRTAKKQVRHLEKNLEACRKLMWLEERLETLKASELGDGPSEGELGRSGPIS